MILALIFTAQTLSERKMPDPVRLSGIKVRHSHTNPIKNYRPIIFFNVSPKMRIPCLIFWSDMVE